ncbi:MAG TPA: hypothetical protein VFO89_08750 [Thermoanaerobaculia bacterium]|nr:hypothetical protein [Thermoanaerobaculia bacterium]
MTNTSRRWTALALAGLLSAAPAVFAKNDKGKKEKHRHTDARSETAFARFDRNGDGWISRAEFPGDPATFARLDANRDGFISRSEARQNLDHDLIRDEYRRLDTNRDGVIARSEWRGSLTAFRQLDRNGDGVLSPADRNEARRDSGRFRGMDRNRDGVITRSEWRGNTTSFRRHDRNRDGLLSGSEVR